LLFSPLGTRSGDETVATEYHAPSQAA
jgi:hypothetical protein